MGECDFAIASISRRAFFKCSEVPIATVALTDNCLALHGVYCESCRECCEAGALRFAPRLAPQSGLRLGSVPQPFFDASLCTQCGECARVCPQDAIRVRPTEMSDG